MLENELKNILESGESGESSLNRGLEGIKETLEGLKEKVDDTDKVFWIVVEELSRQGFLLPNNKMIEIKVANYIKDTFKIIFFKDNVSIFFNENSDEVLAKIKGDTYPLSKEESTHYREKYYSYACQFIEARDKILKEKSNLAKTRLEKLGI